MRPGLRTAVTLLAAGVALTALLYVNPSVGPADASPSVSPLERPTSTSNTSFNGNLSLSTAEPAGSVPAGTQLSVSYRAQVAAYSSSTGTFHVHVPSVVAHFASSGGDLPVTVGPRNLTINGSFPTNSTTPVAVVLAAATQFIAAPAAYLTSGGLAVLSDLPYGSEAVSFQWSWALRLPDGTGESHASAWTNVSPAQYVRVTASGPITVVAGTDYTVCLGGPFQGRVFSLHGEDANAVEFGRSTVPAPASNSSAFCLALAVPAGYPPQPVIFHLWDYESVSLLVHLFRAQVVGGPVGWIDANVSPTNLSLTLDGLPVPASGSGSYNLSVGQGTHRLFATAPGFWPVERDVVVAGNATSFVDLALASQAPSASTHPPAPTVEVVVLVASAAAAVILFVVWTRRSRRGGPPPPPPEPASPAA